MLDVFDWITSPEIREFWRKNYQPTITERLALIRKAHRPMEERLEALRGLLEEAEADSERRSINESIRLLQYALREIHCARAGQYFLLRSPYFTHKLEQAGWPNSSIFISFQDLLDDADVKNNNWRRYGFMVEKWDLTGEKPEEMFTFDLHFIDDKPAVTNLYVNPRQRRRARVSQAALDRDNYGLCTRHPYRLPFSTGTLVKLDAPRLWKPLYGVLYSEDDLNGCRYIFMGHICASRRGLRFDTLDLSYEEIECGWGLRVIDWLHHAAPSELPKGQEVIGEIAQYMRHLRRKDYLAAETLFFHIFEPFDGAKPFRVIPTELSELLCKGK